MRTIIVTYNRKQYLYTAKAPNGLEFELDRSDAEFKLSNARYAARSLAEELDAMHKEIYGSDSPSGWEDPMFIAGRLEPSGQKKWAFTVVAPELRKIIEQNLPGAIHPRNYIV